LSVDSYEKWVAKDLYKNCHDKLIIKLYEISIKKAKITSCGDKFCLIKCNAQKLYVYIKKSCTNNFSKKKSCRFFDGSLVSNLANIC
jgi:hypothetical protein